MSIFLVSFNSLLFICVSFVLSLVLPLEYWFDIFCRGILGINSRCSIAFILRFLVSDL